MNKRKERRDTARRKINSYYNEFNKAAAKYLERMQDKQVGLYTIVQSNEVIATLMRLEKAKPLEIALIGTALKNFCEAVLAENKESLGNG